MSCRTCGREGLCNICCCISPDHRRHDFKLDTCHLCKHPIDQGRVETADVTCFQCQHYALKAVGSGHCLLYDTAIDSEIFAAQDCAGFERIQEGTS